MICIHLFESPSIRQGVVGKEEGMGREIAGFMSVLASHMYMSVEAS
jgi:hypothetical protein